MNACIFGMLFCTFCIAYVGGLVAFSLCGGRVVARGACTAGCRSGAGMDSLRPLREHRVDVFPPTTFRGNPVELEVLVGHTRAKGWRAYAGATASPGGRLVGRVGMRRANARCASEDRGVTDGYPPPEKVSYA